MSATVTTPLPLRRMGQSGVRDLAALARLLAFPAIVPGVFLTPYLALRPMPILFTLSDMFFCLAVVLLAIGHRLPRRPMAEFYAPWLAAFAIMTAGLLLGSLVNGDPARWLLATLQYSFAYLMLPVLFAAHSPAQRVMLAKFLIAGVVGVEIVGAAVYFLYEGTFEDLAVYDANFISGARRVGSFLGDANWNGAVVAMAIPFVLFLRLRGHFGAVTTAGLLAILGLGLMLSASVTAFTSAALAVLVFMAAGGVRPSVRLLLLGAVATSVYFAAGYGLPKAFGERVAPAFETGDLAAAGTFNGRMGLIREAWQIVEKTSVIGLGVDEYRSISADRAPVHNTYLLIWAEGGLIALLGWLGLLVVPVATALRGRRHDRLASALALSVATTFLIFTTASPHMYARIWTVPLFVALGFVLAARRQAAPVQSHREQQQ